MADQSTTANSQIYTAALAEGYEAVMAHVDYRRWAGHAHDLLQAHAPDQWTMGPRRLLELGCGTGALARWLQPRGPYRYLATDRSDAMLDVARREARAQGLPIRFRAVDFTRIKDDLARDEPPFGPPFDAVVLLYDGLNYLIEEEPIRRLMEEAARVLHPGGLFLFDQTTPANSADPTAFEYEDAFDRTDGATVHFRRESRYDPERRLHETTFVLDGPAGRRTEHHTQRAYAMSEIRQLLRASPLEVLAAYDGFTTDPAGSESRRIHWVARLEAGKREGRGL